MSEGPPEDPTRAEPARPEREIAAELRLRPERPRVVRLSRSVLGLLAATSALALGAALIWSLQPERAGAPSELYNTDSRVRADGLSRLPRDYTGIPRLGPPLPGDLGRPMLKAGIRPPPLPGAPLPARTQPDLEAQRRAEERQRIAEEAEAARGSRLFAADVRPEPGVVTSPMIMPDPTMAEYSFAVPGFGQPQPPPTETERRVAFLNGPVDRQTVSDERIPAPASRFILQAGAVIPAALITGIRSDLPGQVSAQVTENVHDSPTGRTLLIPQGARLVGQYDAETTFGQSRALLAWTRLIMPNGRSIVLERQPGADAAGYAGLEDKVDNHWGQVFRAAAISTLLSVATAAGAGNDEDELVRAIRRGSSDGIGQVGRQIVRRSLDIRPTLTIRPGFPVRVILTRDLALEPWRG